MKERGFGDWLPGAHARWLLAFAPLGLEYKKEVRAGLRALLLTEES
jgi:hypothetical protein